jgi:tRNA(Ile)-lysidine synthase TilS/MesJ
LGEIVISKDNARIFEFLGFDYGRYLQGFATKQDIFDYITSNEYFDPTNFQFDNLNSIDRQRNRKRQTYLEFLEYVNSNVFEVKRKYKEKSECIAIIDQFFPESKLIKSIAKFDATEERSHVVRSKFNGNLVMEWTGVVGQELGKVINDFKFDMLITENDFDEFIFDAEADEIKTIFLSWYNNRL